MLWLWSHESNLYAPLPTGFSPNAFGSSKNESGSGAYPEYPSIVLNTELGALSLTVNV